MSDKGRSVLPGIILIFIGVVFLLHQLDVFYFRWRHIYPIMLLGIGAMFGVAVFSKGDRGASFPATVLLTLGVFFFLRNFDYFSFDYYFYDLRDFWPVFLIAFGFGFIVLFAFKRDDWGVLVPGGVLLFFGVVFFLNTLDILYWRNITDFWPVILIAVGVSIVINSLRKKPE
jgi:hypothetical protein